MNNGQANAEIAIILNGYEPTTPNTDATILATIILATIILATIILATIILAPAITRDFLGVWLDSCILVFCDIGTFSFNFLISHFCYCIM